MIDSAEIIAVGTELLFGQIVNTNAVYLARRLAQAGINVYHQSVVGDNRERLAGLLELALSRSDLVVLTGGLGPTEDDLTMSTVAETLGLRLELHAEALRAMEARFAGRGLLMTANNRKQALLPPDQTILRNDNGTAPGARITVDYGGRTRHVCLLPGPPHELQPMWEKEVEPWLEENSSARFSHRYVRTVGIGESALVLRLADLIQEQGRVTIAPYAGAEGVLLRVSQRIEDGGRDETGDVVERILARLGDLVYTVGEESLAEVVLRRFREQGWTLSLAESITGGRIAAALTAVSGASDVLLGSLVTYSEEAKTRLLGVTTDLLQEKGAVSEEAARAMAEGARRALKSHVALAVSGLAGPGRGHENWPVGTVFFALSTAAETRSEQQVFAGSRADVLRRATTRALDLLRREGM